MIETPPRTGTVRLCCPRCLEPLDWGRAEVPHGGYCSVCEGHRAEVRGGRVVDFETQWPVAAEALLAWPDAVLHRVTTWLSAPVEDLPSEIAALTKRAGITDERGTPTAAGRVVAYNLAEYRRQDAGDGVDSLARSAPFGPESRVLDVGCGAGQTLRAIGRLGAGWLEGLDVSGEALALGSRLLEAEAVGVRLVRASALALPYDDGAFSHVVCRVALNYMPQRLALAEMARVLEPGGHLYCRVEGPGFDLKLLRERRGGPRRALAHLRNLFWGSVLEVVGWQPRARRGLLSCDRAFATARRLRNDLKAGCDQAECGVTGRYLGLPLGAEVVVRKRGPSGRDVRTGQTT